MNILTLHFCSVSAFANVPADIIVNNNSSANIIVSIIIGDPPDTETSTNSQVVPIGGGGNIEFSPNQEPFTSVGLNQLQFSFGDVSLDYEVLCGSFFGCVDLTLNLTNITVTLAYPAGASFTETGHADFNTTWRLQANYSVSSLLFNTDGIYDTYSESGFGGTFAASNGNVFINQMYLGSIIGEVPNDLGLTINLETSVDLSGTSLVGTYVSQYGACCYKNGNCSNNINMNACLSDGGDYFGDNSNCEDNFCAPSVCGGGGQCGDIHGPGCDDISCCDAVCDINPECCISIWDAECAVLAIQFCNAIPGNDTCDSAYPIGLERVPFSTLNSSTDGPTLITECATMESGQQFIHDVWFTHTPSQTNGVAVSTCNHADFNTRLAIYDSCNGELIACNDNSDLCADGTSHLCFLGQEGVEYLIRVGGSEGWGSGEIDVSWCDFVDYPQGIAVEWSEIAGGNGHWYALYSLDDGKNYEGAIEAANRFGGYLATLTSPEEQTFVNTHMGATMVGGVTAIGLYQEPKSKEPESGWNWITSEPLDWTNWAMGEPNDASGEDFGMMYPDGTWNDAGNSFGHVLIEFDSDPNLSQTTWDKKTGGNDHTYEAVIFPTLITWNEANAYAENQGGQLVSFETEEEATWVFNELGSFTSLWSMTYLNNGPWIGLYKSPEQWEWLSGTSLDWNGWAPGEPNETGNYGSLFGSSRFFNSLDEPEENGELFGSAQFVNDFGHSRLKLVADGFPSTWGTWISEPLPDEVIGINVSFKMSFKNLNGGPGDGFSFLFGDLSDTSNERASGGEWGINAFDEDNAGLAVCSKTYPALGDNGVSGKWGTEQFTFESLDFSSITYNVYEQALDPNNMATMYINWEKDSGVSVAIAFPSNNPVMIWEDQGAEYLEGINTGNWNFGFAARNGGIDMDVLIGDITFGYEFEPDIENADGSPRNTFDDTYNGNLRRSAIIEYDPKTKTCTGDLNGDGLIGISDLLTVIEKWGPCNKDQPCHADLDEDEIVAIGDLLLIISNWGPCN